MSKSDDDPNDVTAPRQISENPVGLDITNHLTPWMNGQPIFVTPGGDDWWVPIFETEAQLAALMGVFQVPYDNIKKIDDQYAFLDSFPDTINGHWVRFMVNPYRAPDGRLRFKMIVRG